MPFVKGDKRINYKGRPKGSKNKLTKVKDNLIKILAQKLRDNKEIKNIDIKDLIRFASAIIPKDIAIRVAPDIRYISQTPRPEGMLEESVAKQIPLQTSAANDDTDNTDTADNTDDDELNDTNVVSLSRDAAETAAEKESLAEDI
jgi:hypothetical protein